MSARDVRATSALEATTTTRASGAAASRVARANADALVRAIDACARDGEGGGVALAMDASTRDGLIRCAPSAVARLKREAGVRMFYALEPRGEIPEEDTCDVVVFLCRPRLACMVTIAEHVAGLRERRARAMRRRAEAAATRAAKKSSAVDALLTRVASAAGRRRMGGGIDDGETSDSASNKREGEAEKQFPEVPPLPKMFVMCAPRTTKMLEDALRKLHALEFVTMVTCECDLVPIEPDVFTMEYPEAHAEACVEEWDASAYYTAAALHRLQRDFTGLAPVVKGKGVLAHKVAKILLQERLNDKGALERGFVEPGVDGDALIDMIVLIDRDVDMVTPLCTQLTYEGLIDEILGIEKGAVAIPQRAFDGATDMEAEAEADGTVNAYARARAHKAGPVAMRPKLNNTDKLFDQIRDMNFGRACNVIRDLATAIKENYDAIKGSNVADQHVSEIGDFVKKIKANIGGTGLDLHATLAKYLLDCTMHTWFQKRLESERLCVEGDQFQSVMEHIELMINRGDEAIPCLRMIALASVCFNGLPPKMYEKIYSDMLNAFGEEISLKLRALEKAGLFLDRDAAKKRPRGFAQVRKPLKLIADGVDGSEEPTDVTFAFSSSGYAPLSVRLVEAATRGPWKSIAPKNTGEELLKHLPGDLFEYTQTETLDGRPENAKASYREFNKRREKSAEKDGRDELWPKPTVLVFFIGGVTYAEIACLRHMDKKGQCGCNFVVGATSLLHGDTLIDACTENVSRLEVRRRAEDVIRRSTRI